jgi:hypothetical protein
MLRVLFELWPVILPLLVYLLWYWRLSRRCRKDGTCPPRLREGPWKMAVLASILIAVVLLLLWGLSADERRASDYTPPHLQDGRVVPGKVAQ